MALSENDCIWKWNDYMQNDFIQNVCKQNDFIQNDCIQNNRIQNDSISNIMLKTTRNSINFIESKAKLSHLIENAVTSVFVFLK
jgi:hypothetical protein